MPPSREAPRGPWPAGPPKPTLAREDRYPGEGVGVSFTVHKDVMVAMRDGVELATDLWVPEATPAPTLLVRLPYSKDLPTVNRILHGPDHPSRLILPVIRR